MGMCFNKRVLVGLGVVALGVFAVSPRLLGSVAPLLILAACPLSMVFMMRAMNRDGSRCATKRHDAERDDQDDQVARRGDAAEPVAAAAASGGDTQLRELEEEVNRLKAELRLSDQQPSA